MLSDTITQALEEARQSGAHDPWTARVIANLEEAQVFATQVPGSETSADELAEARQAQSQTDRIKELESELAAQPQQPPAPAPQGDQPPPPAS